MRPRKIRLRVEELECRAVPTSVLVGSGIVTAVLAMPEQAQATVHSQVFIPPNPVVPAIPPNPIIPGLGLETAALAMEMHEGNF
jgi:hypothetical protein